MSDYNIVIKEQLKFFLNHEQKKILLIKGKWGVGKTYFWKNFIKSELQNFSQFRAYSYVSLFGKLSSEDIFSEIVGKSEFLNDEIKKLKVSKLPKTLSVLKKMPFISEYKGLIKITENILLNNYLICFDDIERKDDSIKLSTFLGMCDQLREEHCCKIVIILNESQLIVSDKDELQKYREKVLDQELVFEPSIQDNCLLIFDTTFVEEYFEVLKKYNLTNLRILQRINWNIQYHLKFMNDCDVETKNFFINRILTLTFLILSSETSKQFDEISGKSETSKNSGDILTDRGIFFSKYNYYYDNRDDVLITYIKHGIVDEEALKKYISEENLNNQYSKTREQISNFWSRFRSNFTLTPNEILYLAEDLIEKNIDYMNIEDIRSLLKFIIDLFPDYDETHIWEKFVDARYIVLQPKDLEFLKTKVQNSESLKKIEEKLLENYGDATLKELIYNIYKYNSWNSIIVNKLSQASADEYYNWLINETDPELLEALKSFFTTFNPYSPEDEYRRIGNSIFEALSRIAEVDRLKEYQIEKLFNIKRNENYQNRER